MEILVPNPAIRNLIRENKIQQLYGQMQIGQEKFGMQTLNQSLCNLYSRRLISLDECLNRSLEVDELKTMLEQRGLMPSSKGQQQPHR
jgi:twitching motility protein PilT